MYIGKADQENDRKGKRLERPVSPANCRLGKPVEKDAMVWGEGRPVKIKGWTNKKEDQGETEVTDSRVKDSESVLSRSLKVKKITGKGGATG